jgi:hypothetical protein
MLLAETSSSEPLPPSWSTVIVRGIERRKAIVGEVDWKMFMIRLPALLVESFGSTEPVPVQPRPFKRRPRGIS